MEWSGGFLGHQTSSLVSLGHRKQRLAKQISIFRDGASGLPSVIDFLKELYRENPLVGDIDVRMTLQVAAGHSIRWQGTLGSV